MNGRTPSAAEEAGDPPIGGACNQAVRTAFAYFVATAALVVVGFAYECFARNVFSFYMAFCCAVPLVLGLLPAMVSVRFGRPKARPRLARDLWGAGVAALSAASIFQGVMEIYGSMSMYPLYFAAAGALLLVASVVSQIVLRRR